MKKKLLIYRLTSFLLFLTASIFFYVGYLKVKAPILIALAFHDISEDANDAFAISEEKLIDLIKSYKRNDYSAITPQEFEALPKAGPVGQSLKNKNFLLTFDDGKESAVNTIKKLYTEFGISSTVFLILDFIGEPGFMDLATIIELKDKFGCNFGLHGKRHIEITKILENKEDLLTELNTGINILSGLLNHEISWYSFPYGETNASTTKILKQTNIKYAFNVDGGEISNLEDPFYINRIMYTKNAKENQMPDPFSWIKPYTESNGALIVTLSVLVGFLGLNWFAKAKAIANAMEKNKQNNL